MGRKSTISRLPLDVKAFIEGQLAEGRCTLDELITPTGNVRFTAERTPDGHADHFWALALAKAAASSPSAPIEFMSSGMPRGQDAQGFLHA